MLPNKELGYVFFWVLKQFWQGGVDLCIVIFNLILCNMCICWCVGDIFSRYRDKTECYGMFLEFATCYYAPKDF